MLFTVALVCSFGGFLIGVLWERSKWQIKRKETKLTYYVWSCDYPGDCRFEIKSLDHDRAVKTAVHHMQVFHAVHER